MNVDVQRVRQCLKDFEFKRLFIEELNWSVCNNSPLDIAVKGYSCRCIPFAEMAGMVVFAVVSQDGGIPPYAVRKTIEQEVRKQVHEHILIFIDGTKSRSVWQWVKHEPGKQTAVRDHEFQRNQPGDSLLQKLSGIAFDMAEFDNEGHVTIIKVTQRVAVAFDVEKITKRFYDEFKTEHSSFSDFLEGLENQDERNWYVSVMLNRLMFIYFIQKKGFLDGNVDYLAHKLQESKKRGTNQYYRVFLISLFFEGFAKEEKQRSPVVNQSLGKVPYLNGGLFLPHQLEVAHGESINISDAAFERLFAFFERYSWHLDYRPLKADNEINPDVLGYIFEKYINQKQMGAYYTKEDITDYICKNTIIPFLFDKLENLRYEELHPFPMKEVEPYIYGAVKQETNLPTETDREYKARQKRYQQIKADFAAGKITNINDLITYNLDIRKFAEDWAKGIKDPVTLRAFYFHCLTKLTILDPAVGSGAFLFAALNMLEPLYESCLDKMQKLGGPKYDDFAQELARVNQHPNRKYFVFKSIIVNNLFGVDIMEEAVEICKLRLFLKLVSQVDDVDKIEPLPDIDFNIRAGNSLVGYASQEEIEKAKKTQLDLSGALKGIEQQIENTDRSLKAFRDLQTKFGIPASELAKAKAEVTGKLAEIQKELDRDLAAFYGARDINQFIQTHHPFHWFVEFYGIMKDGGFDVIIGNPPYVEYKDVKSTYRILNYDTMDCNNLFAYILDRCSSLGHESSCVGMIVPLSAFSTDRMVPLISHIKGGSSVLHIANFGWRPGKLFEGVNLPLSIIIQVIGKHTPVIFTTKYLLWESEAREGLFSKIEYAPVKDERLAGSIPKLGVTEAVSIFDKLRSRRNEIGSCFNAKSDPQNKVFYRRGGLYWKVFVDYATGSSEEKIINIIDGIDPRSIIAALSSNLWFWYFTSTSDCRHLGRRDIDTFPFDPREMSPPLYTELCKLGQEYVLDLRRHAGIEVRTYKGTKSVECLSFMVKESKPIIDKIDQLLAQHYGFTKEELDFIINYDIKYRMGKDNEEEC